MRIGIHHTFLESSCDKGDLSNKNYVGIYYAYVPTLVDAYCGCVISLPPGEEPGPFSFGDATGKITGADGICGHLGYCGQCYSWNYADPPMPTPTSANGSNTMLETISHVVSEFSKEGD